MTDTTSGDLPHPEFVKGMDYAQNIYEKEIDNMEDLILAFLRERNGLYFLVIAFGLNTVALCALLSGKASHVVNLAFWIVSIWIWLGILAILIRRYFTERRYRVLLKQIIASREKK